MFWARALQYLARDVRSGRQILEGFKVKVTGGIKSHQIVTVIMMRLLGVKSCRA